MKLLIDMPDLPLRAFQRVGRNILPQGKGSAPAAPDYAAAAQQTAEGNLENARYATQANRPNQITPWGTLSWDNGRSFDQAGYDAALKAYEQNMASGATRSPSVMDGWNPIAQAGLGHIFGGGESQNLKTPVGVAPNREDFYTGGDSWTSTMTLSPQMQALFDQEAKLQQGMFGAQDQALGRVNQMMGQGFDMSKLPAAGTALNMNSLPGYGTAFGGSRGDISVYDPNQATNNAAELLMSRMNPELDRQQEALRGQLANQGITQGSEAYNRAMAQNQYGRNDANTQAQLQGIGLGMQQQGQAFGQQLSNRQLTAAEQAQQFGQQTTNQQLAAALQNQQFGQQQGLRGQSMQEQAYLRNLPLNELNALRTGNQVSQPQFGGFAQQATTGGPDMSGAVQNQYNAALGASNAQNAAASGTLGGLFSIGGSLLQGAGAAGGFGALFSDRRLKKNIRRIGKAANGLNIYSYQYVWGGARQIGHMADEVEKVSPHAVGRSMGFKTVNYGAI